MKLARVISLFIFLLSSYLVQSQSAFTNSDFELANFIGRSGEVGLYFPISTTSSSIISGKHTIMNGSGTNLLLLIKLLM